MLCAVLLVASVVTLTATVADAADTQFTLTTNYTGLYPDADAYLRQWDAAVDRIVAVGGVLADDADALRERGREIAAQSL